MKLGLATFNQRQFLAAQVDSHVFDLSTVISVPDLTALIRDWERWRPIVEAAIDKNIEPIEGAVWASPIPHPPKFLLLAGNFRAHVVESGFAAVPDENLTPQFFIKPSTTIIGPTENIPLTSANHALDYEAELGVIIGATTRNAKLEDAMNAVWGYTIVNDVSERKLNATMQDRKKRSNDDFYDWLVGKWFDGSAPMGPYVVTADEAPSEFMIIARLNGDVVQKAPTSAMIHSVAEAIVYISSVLTLEPGDVIAMGTPAGVGMARNRLLQHDDVIECEISGIGAIRNRVCQR